MNSKNTFGLESWLALLLCLSIGHTQSAPLGSDTNQFESGLINQMIIEGSTLILELKLPARITPKQEIRIEGKIQNNGKRPILVYMPGLSLYPNFTLDPKTADHLRVDGI